jgi:flagellar hook-basal body complex protein FliE
MNSIHGLMTNSTAMQLPASPRGVQAEEASGSFKDFLLRSIQDVNNAQTEANHAVEELMTGGDADPAAVLTAVEKADLAFRMMLQMRNKVMQVYQEVRDIRI